MRKPLLIACAFMGLLIGMLVSQCVQAQTVLGVKTFTQSGLNIIGPGCTTFAYIDHDCDGCGVGVKSSGSYPLQTGTPPGFGTAPFWTMGDTIDADDTDPTVCTTAQWQAKWGWTTPDNAADNAALQSFLQQKKGMPASFNIYYLSLTGNDVNCQANRPDLPCASMNQIMKGLQPAVTQEFSGTASVVLGQNLITITAVASGALKRGDLLNSGNGVPVNTYVIGQRAGCCGGIGTYVITNNANATNASRATTGSYQNGGAVIIRVGSWNTLNIRMDPQSPNPSWQLSGSPGHPLLVMNYPGEIVLDTYKNGIGGMISETGSSAPGRATCCLILDGIQTYPSAGFDTGQGLNFAQIEDVTIQNMEFAGYNDTIFANDSKGIKYFNNVFHEIGHHAVYMSYGSTFANPNFASGQCAVPPPTDWDFSLDSVNFLFGISCGSQLNLREIGNVLYDGGTSGFDLLHNNTISLQVYLTGNIQSFTGGNAFNLASGNYATAILGNLSFDNGGSCLFIFSDSNHDQAAPTSHKWNTYSNNTCFNIDPALSVWAKQPNPPTSQASTTCTIVGSTSGSTLTITAIACVGMGASMYLFGPGVPANTTVLPFGTNGTTGAGTTGTYALSQAVTTSEPGGTSFTSKNPLWHLVSNTTIKNNVIVETDNGQSQPWAFDFDYQSFPDTDVISCNLIFSQGTQNPPRILVVTSDAGGSIPGGTYPFSGTTSFSTFFPGNTYANPSGVLPLSTAGGCTTYQTASNPGWNVSSAIYQTPGAYNFGLFNLQ